jgi:diketogulonate reductase-like aldo/keto reductase
VLRWHMQLGNIAIPKSVTPARIRENIGIFDFTLDEDEMRQLSRLATGERIGPLSVLGLAARLDETMQPTGAWPPS